MMRQYFSKCQCVFTFLVFVLVNAAYIEGFIHKECVMNVTQPSAICCPAILSDEICGGPLRGVCKEIRPHQRRAQARYANVVSRDDRVYWPLRFFTYSCVCKASYEGVACEQTRPSISSAKPKVRRNMLKLSKRDRDIFHGVLVEAKVRMSDYLVPNISTSDNCDPTLPNSLSPDLLTRVSVYDLFTFLHVYATKTTMKPGGVPMLDNCVASDNILNYAHKGPGFFTWHRHFLMVFERELSKIAEDIYGITDFTLPYWDWVGQSNCTVCTMDYIGRIEVPVRWPNPLNNTGNSTSNTILWPNICRTERNDNGCHICDPGNALLTQPPLWRKDSNPPIVLPNQAQIDFLMTLRNYDSQPYDWSVTSYRGFRNLGEGFMRFGYNSTFSPNMTKFDFDLRLETEMKRIFVNASETKAVFHNLVHNKINGSVLDVANSPSDPFFYAHHIFVDKIFEMWLRKFGVNNKYPNSEEVPYGHHMNDYIIPIWPLTTNIEMFKVSTDLGYTYDDNYLGTSLAVPDATPSIQPIIFSSVIGAIMLLVICTMTIILTIKFCRQWYRNKKLRNQLLLPQDEEYDGNYYHEPDLYGSMSYLDENSHPTPTNIRSTESSKKTEKSRLLTS